MNHYTCTFIINVEKLSKELLSLDVIKGLADVVSISSQSLDVVNMALQALAVIVEYGKRHKCSLLRVCTSSYMYA